MKPTDLGLPDRFEDWRVQQETIIWRTVRSSKRYIAHAAPTGSGKSLAYMANAVLESGRVAVLTSTKGLQSQLMGDFEATGLFDIRGQNNYACLLMDDGTTVDQGVCHAGENCSLKNSGCLYYDAYRTACRSRLVVTNYSYWLHSYAYGEGLGAFSLLILDEAHAAPNELANFLAVFVGVREVDEDDLGAPPKDPARWREWATTGARAAVGRLGAIGAELNRGNNRRRHLIRHYRSQAQRLGRIAKAEPSNWVMEPVRGGWKWDCVWPQQYKRMLFQGADKVALYSATLRPKTMELLGLTKEDYEFHEYRSPFPVDNRPVVWVPTIKLSREAGPAATQRWLGRIQEIVAARRDRRGIVLPVSYERAQMVATALSFAGERVITHGRDGAAQAVETFRRTPRSVLVSPSVGTGYDFPYQECEYLIIAKIPFADRSSAVQRAREVSDRSYSGYQAATELVQAAGRAVRAEDDRAEVFIIDDNWGWFKAAYHRFIPRWFMESVRRRDTVPEPPPPLRAGH